MKNIVIIGIALLLFSSCSKKWCTEHYPCIDSTNYREVVKIDTTWLKLPTDTTYIELPFDCPDQQIIYKEGKKETIVRIKDKVMYVKYVSKEDSVRIINLFKESKEFKQAVKEVYVPEWYIPKFIWYALGSMFILVLFAYRKFIFKLFSRFSS